MIETKNKYIAHVAAGLEPEAGGPSFTIPLICESINARGTQVELHSCGIGTTGTFSVKTHFHPVSQFANRLRFSNAMFKALKEASSQIDVIHSHGLWMMPSYYCDWIARNRQCIHVISPHGSLSNIAFAKSQLRKKLIWNLWQKGAMQRAKCIHTTCEREYHDIRRMGIRTPVAVIGIGIDSIDESLAVPKRESEKNVLYLGRIDPIKALPNLLQAWESLGEQTKDWNLQIVGSGDPHYIQHVKDIIVQRHLPNAAVYPPAYGANKSKAYFNADLFVLPSESENFSVSVAEALGHGVPCIVSKGAPWKSIESNRCGWWVENDSNSIASSLRTALALSDDERREMGKRGRELVEQNFSWQVIASKYIELYSWLRGHAPCPSFVHVD
jgi:glycosyltransferase involved in cell wall biosynthesis